MNIGLIKQNLRGQSGFVPIAVVLIVLIVIGFAVYKITSLGNKPAPPVYEVVKRSKTLGYINGVTTTRKVNPKTNQATDPTSDFTTSDNPIYLVADLNNPPVGTRIDYIRYLNGKYIDHRSVQIDQAGTKSLVFDWVSTVIGIKRPTGAYRVKLYANGILEKRANYNVALNKSSAFELYLGNLLNTFI